MREIPPTFLFRGLLALSLIASISGLLPNIAAAQPKPKVVLGSITLPDREFLHVTLRTQEGVERFVFSAREPASNEDGELHYSGFARARNFQRDKLPAAMTIAGRHAWIFYTSRRTGRPAAATISLRPSPGTPKANALRVSRVPRAKLACGSHAGDDEHSSESAHPGRLRRRNTPSQGIVTALGVKPFSPARVLEVATEADPEFYALHGDNTNPYIRAVLNAVDVIYTSSLGVKIKVTAQRVTKSKSGRRGVVEASDLLESFRQSPFGSSSAGDVRHLFTGRDIDGLTIGIAYVGAVCTAEGRYGVGLSYAVEPGLAPFLTAHELAHNLSATHDLQARSIMNPAITEANNRFTDKALADMRDFVSTIGSCLATEDLSTPKTRVDPSDPHKFLAQVTFSTSKPTTCSVTLYGSSDGRRYIPLANQSVRSPGATGTGTVSFFADAPPLTPQQTFQFKARVSCNRVQTTSPVAKARYGSASTGASGLASATRWLEALKQNLTGE